MEKETNREKMKNGNLKERIQTCLLALDFDTDRMSTSGNEAYNELRKIVVDLYNDNIKMIESIKTYELGKVKDEEEEQI